MKTVDKTKIELVEALAITIAHRKAAEKTEKELKARVRAVMGEESTLDAGDWMIVLKKCQRIGIDMDALKTALGSDVIKPFQTVTNYDQMDVVKK